MEAANFIFDLIQSELEKRDWFSFFLSGGKTPEKLYKILSQNPEINWNKIHIFWGDERYVSMDNENSNFRMANNSILSVIDIAEGNIHPINTDIFPPEKSAEEYERELKTFLLNYTKITEKELRPTFDLILLGVGGDGHTASLFTDEDYMEKNERWVKAVPVPDVAPKVARITITLRVINNARWVIFMVAGENKFEIIDKVIKEQRGGNSKLPAGKVRPEKGKTFWFIAKK